MVAEPPYAPPLSCHIRVLNILFTAVSSLCKKQRTEMLIEQKSAALAWSSVGEREKTWIKACAEINSSGKKLMRRLPRSIKTSFIYLSSDSTASLDTRHKQWHMNCAGDGRQKMARDSAHTQRGGQVFGEHLHVWCCGTNIHMNACTHMQTSEKRRQKRVKKRYSVIATGNNYTLNLPSRWRGETKMEGSDRRRGAWS